MQQNFQVQPQATVNRDGVNFQEMVTQPGMQYVQTGVQYMQPNVQFQAQPSGIQEEVSMQYTNMQVQPLQMQPGMPSGQEGDSMQYMQPDVQLQLPQLYT